MTRRQKSTAPKERVRNGLPEHELVDGRRRTLDGMRYMKTLQGLLILVLCAAAHAQTAWRLQATPVGWQFVAPDGAITCKYNAVSKMDIQDLQSAGTDAAVEAKYGGGNWDAWASQQDERLRSLGFTAAGMYSYQYSASYPANGVPFTPTYGLSGYAMQDNAHNGLGPYHAKDLGFIPYTSGMNCGPRMYQGSEIDPYDPNTQPAFNDFLANDFIHGWNFTHAMIVVPEEADFLFGIDQSNNPNNAHPDMGLIIAASNPMVLKSRGDYFYPNSGLYAKQAMRDYLLNEYLCLGPGNPVATCTGVGTGTGSADPSSGSYVGAANASTALVALNAAWGTNYTTWNTSDAGGLTGISNNNGSPVSGEAFATGDASTYSFTHTAATPPVHASSYQVFVNGIEVGFDDGQGAIGPFGGSTLADGTVPQWLENHAYLTNTVSRSPLPSNCAIIATTGGTTGSSQPTWPACPGTSPLPTVNDGTVVWTMLGPRSRVTYTSGVGSVTFTAPPANGAAITINYTGGQAPYQSWGGNAACSANNNPYACCTGNGTGTCTQGTGFLDEAGFNIVKAGQNCGGLTGNGPQENEDWSNPAQIQTDIDNFVAVLAGYYAQEVQTGWLGACGSTCPPLAMPVYDGPVNGTASVYAAMAPFVDLFWIAPSWYPTLAGYTAAVHNIIDNDQGKPVIVANYFRANPDSWTGNACDGSSGLDCSLTQSARGAFYVSFNQSVLRLTNPNGKYAVVGFEHWALYDSESENRDFGLFTPNDNGYDGSAGSTATSSGACTTIHAYTAPAICQDSNGNLESLAVSSCTSGGSDPPWNVNFNGLTSGDGTCNWFNQGSYTRSAEAADWGNSLLPIVQFNSGNLCDPGPATTPRVTLGEP